MTGARLVACAALALAGAAIAAPPAPSAPVTDATVAARVQSIGRKQDHEALAAYYRAKAAAAEPAIAAREQLLRAYMALDPKTYSGLQKEARALLKGARLTKKQYDLLATVHQRMAWEWED
jgi:hypothetical protein